MFTAESYIIAMSILAFSVLGLYLIIYQRWDFGVMAMLLVMAIIVATMVPVSNALPKKPTAQKILDENQTTRKNCKFLIDTTETLSAMNDNGVSKMSAEYLRVTIFGDDDSVKSEQYRRLIGFVYNSKGVSGDKLKAYVAEACDGYNG